MQENSQWEVYDVKIRASLKSSVLLVPRRYQGSNLGFGKMEVRIPSDNHYTIAPLCEGKLITSFIHESNR